MYSTQFLTRCRGLRGVISQVLGESLHRVGSLDAPVWHPQAELHLVWSGLGEVAVEVLFGVLD